MIGLKSTLLSVAATASLLVGTPASAAANIQGETVILVHGAFADGSSWDKVIPILEARGLHVIAVQNPLSSLADDTAATKRAIETAVGPVILVGHSWGGAVISQAGEDAKVRALVYVAALIPDKGQSANDLTKGQPSPAWAAQLQKDSGGFLTLPAQTLQTEFAQDLAASETRLMAATQGPWAASCLEQPLTVAAWHDKPSWSVIPGDDHMIAPALQESMARTIGAKVVRVKASHAVLLSQPAIVADTIIAAAEAVKR